MMMNNKMTTRKVADLSLYRPTALLITNITAFVELKQNRNYITVNKLVS